MSNDTVFDEAKVEFLRRVNAKERLINFAQYVDGSYEAESVHKFIARVCDKLVHEPKFPYRGVVINVAPQVGKSHLISVLFPPYWLAHRPNDPVILTSYASELAEDKSKQIQQIMDSVEYKTLFPGVGLDPNFRSIEHWRLAQPNKGSLITGGVKGGITGFGAKLAIIDDPYKNWEEAQSDLLRKKVELFFQFVLRTRMWKGAKWLCVMTRWHPKDLTSFLAQRDKVLVIRIPALCESQEERDRNNHLVNLPLGLPDPLDREEGESCAPSRMPVEHLNDIRSDSGSLVWYGLYQQAPRAFEGNTIKRDWFLFADSLPLDDNLEYVRYFDKAGTQDAGKYTAGVLMAFSPLTQMFYIVDATQVQFSAGKREKLIKELTEQDNKRFPNHIVTYVEQEPASGGKESAENTIYNLSNFRILVDKVRSDKMTRLLPFAAKLETKRVCLIRAPWNDTLIDQFCDVPDGEYMDLVDASSGAYAKLVATRTRTYTGRTVIHQGAKASSDLLNLYRSLNVPMNR